MNLFVLGNVANDSLFYVNKYPKSGETILAKKIMFKIFNKSYKTAKITKKKKDSFIRKKFKKLLE